MATAVTESSLSGYQVLDLTDEKGMLCSRLLADMGAEVVRIEKTEDNQSSSFIRENLGKSIVNLNIETKSSQRTFKNLVKSADILVESFQAGYMESLGLDYSYLSAINPRLIMASITPFGQTGPHRAYKASDLITSAMGGHMYVCGEQDMPPLKPFGNQTYYTACLFAANGIMLALWHRHTTGKGQHMDVSIQECTAATLDHVLVRYFYQNEIARRQGSLHWNGAFRIFPCKDGYILLSLFLQWETLVEWLDSEGMAEDLTDKKWLDHSKRLKHIDHLIEVMERWTLTHTVDELVQTGQLMHFPWAKVTSVPELLDSPQLKERGFFKEADGYKYPGLPWKVGIKL